MQRTNDFTSEAAIPNFLRKLCIETYLDSLQWFNVKVHKTNPTPLESQEKLTQIITLVQIG